VEISNGWLAEAKQVKSPHFNQRPDAEPISLLVLHNISLPPGEFGGNYIEDFFLGKLDKGDHPYFADIYQMKVSAHCLIKRDGNIVQFVSFNDRAWHAGVSQYQQRENCNDFSIGIELEGTDDISYTSEQYQQLSLLTQAIKQYYPQIADNIVGHCDIAPKRKTDPGASFDWNKYYALIGSEKSRKS